jgi:hypothetical protein
MFDAIVHNLERNNSKQLIHLLNAFAMGYVEITELADCREFSNFA